MKLRGIERSCRIKKVKNIWVLKVAGSNQPATIVEPMQQDVVLPGKSTPVEGTLMDSIRL